MGVHVTNIHACACVFCMQTLALSDMQMVTLTQRSKHQYAYSIEQTHKQSHKQTCALLSHWLGINVCYSHPRWQQESPIKTGFCSGVPLTRGAKVFFDISQHFTDYRKAMALATKLLKSVNCGGPSFVWSLYAPVGVPPTQYITLRVLEEWCQHQPEQSYGGNLLEVLRSVLPSAAVTFENTLLGPPENLGRC